MVGNLSAILDLLNLPEYVIEIGRYSISCVSTSTQGWKSILAPTFPRSYKIVMELSSQKLARLNQYSDLHPDAVVTGYLL